MSGTVTPRLAGPKVMTSRLMNMKVRLPPRRSSVCSPSQAHRSSSCNAPPPPLPLAHRARHPTRTPRSARRSPTALLRLPRAAPLHPSQRTTPPDSPGPRVERQNGYWVFPTQLRTGMTLRPKTRRIRSGHRTARPDGKPTGHSRGGRLRWLRRMEPKTCHLSSLAKRRTCIRCDR
jgi:hypothetical protein